MIYQILKLKIYENIIIHIFLIFKFYFMSQQENSIGRRFTSLNEFTPTWDFRKERVFEGFYIEQKTITPKNHDEFDVIVFETEEGVQYNLPSAKNILTAIEKAPIPKKDLRILFRIEFIEKKKIAGGKTVNIYNISYCETL